MNGAAFAPAKVNLYLHVGPPGADGYHPLCSLMVFADVGDRLAAAPARNLSLDVGGPFADALAGQAAEGNLVLRAARALLARAGLPEPGLALALDKRLPVASGLGGGSADAGAALRLLRGLLAPTLDDMALEAIALDLGSDGPACLWGRPTTAEGRGERLGPAPSLPALPAVLVNPRVACPTGAVYRAYDAAPHPDGAQRPALPDGFDDVAVLAAALSACRNDLERPAARLVPEVAAVLRALRAQPETLLARLSGSGATAFALCADGAAAETLAARLAAGAPGWWVRACRLGGPWADAASARRVDV